MGRTAARTHLHRLEVQDYEVVHYAVIANSAVDVRLAAVATHGVAVYRQ